MRRQLIVRAKLIKVSLNLGVSIKEASLREFVSLIITD